MRVGQVAFAFRPIIGGAEVYIEDLLRVLEEAGHTSRVYQRDPGAEERAQDKRIVPIRPVRRRPLVSYNLLLLTRLAELRREDRLVVHDTYHFSPVLWHPGTVVLSHGVTWDHPDDQKTNARRRWLAELAWRRARTVVANDSEFLREMGLTEIEPGTRLFEQVAPRRFLIPNVVDPERFSPGPGMAALEGLPIILVPRNIVFGRGIHLAVEAFATVAQERADVVMLIAGGWFDPLYRDRVRALIHAHGLSGRVLFTDSVPHAELATLYRSAAATLIPTVCWEGTSLAALESMSCGTPVVATRVGGLKDLPCELVNPEPRAIGLKLLETLDARDERATRQRQAVLERFTPDRWARSWLEAIEI